MPKTKINIDINEFLEIYRPLLNSTNDIEFLWGSRDSGKSRFVAQNLVLSCLKLDYFVCPLFRKVHNTIKDSQWAMIKLIIEDWKLEKFFDFTISPLEIRCINGNKFIARGLDDPLKIKSLTNPSHAWIEEASDLGQDDWVLILTSLRSDFGKTQTWCSFNPDVQGDYEENYMYKTFFAGSTSLSFSNVLIMEVEGGEIAELNYRITHSTYKDNPYCDPQRRFQYENLKNLNQYEYTVYALGLWGRRITGGEFLKGFEIGEHVGHTKVDINKIIHLSIDSNVFPYISMTFWQFFKDEAGQWQVHQVYEILGTDPNNTARASGDLAAQWLKNIGYTQRLFLYGDRSIKNRNNIDDDKRSFFTIFIDSLRRRGYNIEDKFLSYMPPASSVGDFVNAILQGHLTFAKILIGDHCKKSITDYIDTKQDIDGSILKKRVTDKNTGISYEPNAHLTDTFKDLIVQAFYTEYSNYQNRNAKIVPGQIKVTSRVGKYTL